MSGSDLHKNQRHCQGSVREKRYAGIIRSILTRLEELTSTPAAFAVLVVYFSLWLIADRCLTRLARCCNLRHFSYDAFHPDGTWLPAIPKCDTALAPGGSVCGRGQTPLAAVRITVCWGATWNESMPAKPVPKAVDREVG